MGLGSFVKNVVSLGSSGSAQREQDSANRAALTSWTMANDYNHPVAQMERLKAAGLNPNLVYGSGSVTGNTATTPHLVGSKEKSTLDYASRSAERVLSAATGKAQLDNTTAQAQLTSAQAITAGAQASNAQAIAGYELKSAEASADYDVAKAQKARNDNQFFLQHGYYPAQEDVFVRRATGILEKGKQFISSKSKVGSNAKPSSFGAWMSKSSI